MKVIFRSRDFASVEGLGLGFTNRRPTASAWTYQGRVQHTRWQGIFDCHWEQAADATNSPRPTELLWVAHGDARLFGLAAALKSAGFVVDVEQD
ncbi:MAG: hypothetical protein J2P37_28035 [Ktedonobacteraceae bacterium]|nr:hypothetical protein [Ktedonobacteraceae bacterium]MBO0792751.1 hypothetical protein [Ktedonobacteraceae bacterium]